MHQPFLMAKSIRKGFSTDDMYTMSVSGYIVYKAYIISYICDFILELLRMIHWMLELLMKAKGSKSKQKRIDLDQRGSSAWELP